MNLATYIKRIHQVLYESSNFFKTRDRESILYDNVSSANQFFVQIPYKLTNKSHKKYQKCYECILLPTLSLYKILNSNPSYIKTCKKTKF